MSMQATQSEPQRPFQGTGFRLSTDEAIRIPDPRKVTYEYMQHMFAELNGAEAALLLQVREKSYDVLDRIDEILINGGHVSPEQIDDLVRGIAMVEEVLIKKMNGQKIDTIKSRLDL